MTYQDALTHFFKWAKQLPDAPNHPNESLSEEHDGDWHLHNINGPLAVVMSNGDVIAVGNFWAAYERLAEDGKCDSPGGAEYRRVLREWIEQEPDDMETFILRRANAGPGE
jgi:hypothetical protein